MSKKARIFRKNYRTGIRRYWIKPSARWTWKTGPGPVIVSGPFYYDTIFNNYKEN